MLLFQGIIKLYSYFIFEFDERIIQILVFEFRSIYYVFLLGIWEIVLLLYLMVYFIQLIDEKMFYRCLYWYVKFKFCLEFLFVNIK